MGRHRTDVRISNTRNVEKVFLLAFEGAVTENNYFKGIVRHLELKNISLNKIDIFKKSNKNLSNPLKIVKELIESKIQEGFDHEDINLIVDRDPKSFTEKQYDEVVELCKKENINLFISNPSFEIWLLFHFLKTFDKTDRKKISDNKNYHVELLQDKLIERKYSRAKKFNKDIRFKHYENGIENAVKLCEKVNMDDMMLKEFPGTNVGFLVKKIMN